MAQTTVPARVQETDFTADRVDAFNTSTSASTSDSQPHTYGSITHIAPEPEPDDQPAPPAENAPQAPAFTRAARLLAPDLLRGLLMVLQSIDHGSVSAGAWRHGQALETEGDSIPVTTWNDPVPWTMRSLTHLCASGFMFLLGFGVVMFGRSRVKLGWSARALVWHFFVRAAVLTILSEVLGLFITGFRVLFFNIVLMSLGVNYLLAGLLWLLINTTETTLTAALDSWLAPSGEASAAAEDEQQPLLNTETSPSTPAPSAKAARISFWLHNAALAALTFVTIAWNKWMSPTDGHCTLHSKTAPAPAPETSGWRLAWDFWWYAVMDMQHGVVSGFPPLAWLSFAVVGVLYARIYLARPWAPYAVNAGNALAAVFFALLFVGTRLLHVGNLTEGCLRMPEQHGGNQFFASFRAFFYVAKYPPDAGFFTYTLAMNFALLAGFGALPAWIGARIPTLLVFGKCALFFYIMHMFVYTSIGKVDKMLVGRKMGYEDPFAGGEAVGIGNGPVFWVSWLVGLAVMYPLCYYYGNFKSRKGPDSLWRFF